MRARVVIIVLALICAGGLLASNVFSSDGYPRIRKLQLEVDRLKRSKRQLQQEIADFQHQLEALKAGGKYLQKTIRDELGYVRDDEVIVDLIKDTEQ